MKETSAGAVIFRNTKKGRLYLVLHYPSGHWDLVKGKMEGGESPRQTAVREAREETGIKDLEFIRDFRETIGYTFQFEGRRINKKVIFYLAKTETESVTISHEHQDFLWLSFGDAKLKTTYDNARRTISKAEKLLGGL